MDDILFVEDLVGICIFRYDIDFFDGAVVEEPARRSIKKYEQNVQCVQNCCHICYINNIHALFKAFHCRTCHKNFQTPGNMERHLVRCCEVVKYIYPKKVYQLRVTLFNKLDSFDIQYTDVQKLFNILAVFSLESICIPEEKFNNFETTTSIGKHVRISVSISSNLKVIPIFICNFNQRDLLEPFIDAVEGLATKKQSSEEIEFFGSRNSNQK